MSSVEQGIAEVLSRIEGACQRSQRSSTEVTIVAATKTRSAALISDYVALMGRLGQAALIGENYVQEFHKKSHAIAGEYVPVLIGPLQRNKVAQALTLFREIESVDRMEVIDALSRAAITKQLVLPVFLQVNVSNDPRKKGFAVAAVEEVAQKMRDVPALKLKGLMTITELYAEPEEARSDFIVMRNLRDALQQLLGVQSLELSMGMSSDFEIAVEEGATRVRIGEALFGPRDSGA